jgi:hypothetical protein
MLEMEPASFWTILFREMSQSLVVTTVSFSSEAREIYAARHMLVVLAHFSFPSLPPPPPSPLRPSIVNVWIDVVPQDGSFYVRYDRNAFLEVKTLHRRNQSFLGHRGGVRSV